MIFRRQTRFALLTIELIFCFAVDLAVRRRRGGRRSRAGNRFRKGFSGRRIGFLGDVTVDRRRRRVSI